MEARIDILVPVLGRPYNVQPLLDSATSSTSVPHRVLFIATGGDRAEIKALEDAGADYIIHPGKAGSGNYGKKINWGYTHTDGDYLFMGADDIEFAPGWDTVAVRAMKDKVGVVATNDKANRQVMRGEFGTHNLIRRTYISDEGGTFDGTPGVVLYEGYDHWYCNPPEAPVWMADGRFTPIGNVKVGDVLVGWERIEAEASRVGTPRRALAYSEVLAVSRRVSPLVRVVLESGREFSCTPDHRWLNAVWSPASSQPDNQFVVPKVGRQLLHVIDEPTPLPPGSERLAGWLAGIYDGEGSGIYVATQSTRHNPEVATAISNALNELNVPHRMSMGEPGIAHFVLHGGRQGYLNFLLRFDPVRRDQLLSHVLGWRQLDTSRRERAPIGGRRFGRPDRIAAVEAISGEHEVVALATSTGNYIAHGYASRNCDRELCDVARARRAFAFASRSVVRHRHPIWRTAPDDATYRKGQAHAREDHDLYARRLQAFRSRKRDIVAR